MTIKTRAVSQYEGTQFVAQYYSVAFAAAVTGVDASHLAKVARGERNTTGGWSFKYISRVATINVPSKTEHVVLLGADGVTPLAKFVDKQTAQRLLSWYCLLDIPSSQFSTRTLSTTLTAYIATFR